MVSESITVEPYGGVADIAFWPLILLLIVLVWRFRADRGAVAWCTLAALAIVVSAAIYIIVFGPTSLSVLHDFDIALAVLGSFVLVMFAGVVHEITFAGWREDRVLGLFAVAMTLVGLAMLVAGLVVPAQDLLLPRRIVEGDITLLETRGRRPVTYVVRIGDMEAQASTPLYRTLRRGQPVRAEISAGSDFIRRLERNPGASAK